MSCPSYTGRTPLERIRQCFLTICFPTISALSIAALLFPAPATAQQRQVLDREALEQELRNAPPKPHPNRARKQPPSSPNPYLALLPDSSEADWGYWQREMKASAQGSVNDVMPGIATRAGVEEDLIRYKEREGIYQKGVNDTIETAEFLAPIGSGDGDIPQMLLRGDSPGPILGGSRQTEDDGAIPLANRRPALSGWSLIFEGAVIGDGPHGRDGTNLGDFDFYKLEGVKEGQTIIVDIDTPRPFGDLDPYVVVWNADGVPFLASDDDAISFDSFLLWTAQEDGDYYVSVGGWGSFFPLDPFDSSSGGLGQGSIGEYDITISFDINDTDVFSMDLEAGDVIGIGTQGVRSYNDAVSVSLLDPSGFTLVDATLTNAAFVYPDGSPLPRAGNANLSYVVSTAGRYAVEIKASDKWNADLRVFRPGSQFDIGSRPTRLFLDFDGETLDTRIYDPTINDQPRTLSGLRAFLPSWGLDASDEDAVIDAILATIEENLGDVADLGSNGSFDDTGIAGQFRYRLRNSRDHRDLFGRFGRVTRVVVGGTISESGIETIGIAESIDPGDFNRAETALVLLDIVSSPRGSFGEGRIVSINDVELAPGASKIDLIGRVIGNIVTHEAGHYWGNFHTENEDPFANIMDQGGNFAQFYGLGPDLVFGTADDEDVDFGFDFYELSEGFLGVEDTLDVVSFGLSTGLRIP